LGTITTPSIERRALSCEVTGPLTVTDRDGFVEHLVRPELVRSPPY
jgi:hypothetical protein